ncbi:hypothetical protein CCACVL1_18394 [Corchorus capsularis]|uniref:Uncharacterized protein n=1 Tax=Corchorus capsularis TaxID=210143 RepID=A0A1R3HLG2_COCAP|nr:hypothetical protein CCACVL1_18394 [Corchorus capsularis]
MQDLEKWGQAKKRKRPYTSVQDSHKQSDAPRAYHGFEEHNGANGDHASDKLGDVSDIQEAAMVDPGLKGSMEEHGEDANAQDRPLHGGIAHDRPWHVPIAQDRAQPAI